MKKVTTVILSLILLLNIFQNMYAEPSDITHTTALNEQNL